MALVNDMFLFQKYKKAMVEEAVEKIKDKLSRLSGLEVDCKLYQDKFIINDGIKCVEWQFYLPEAHNCVVLSHSVEHLASCLKKLEEDSVSAYKKLWR
jgi:hypothetical protein